MRRSNCACSRIAVERDVQVRDAANEGCPAICDFESVNQSLAGVHDSVAVQIEIFLDFNLFTIGEARDVQRNNARISIARYRGCYRESCAGSASAEEEQDRGEQQSS